MWKKDQVVVKAVLVLYGSQPVTRRAWKSVGAVVKAMAALHRVQLRRLHKRDHGSSDDPSPTSDAFLEGNQAVSRHGCLCRLGPDRDDASEQMTLVWLTRILYAGLDPAQTRDGNLASVSHLLRGHRSQAVQDHLDCFLLHLRLCGDRLREATLGQDRTCS